MKIIGIASSPHRNGNSATLLREALKGAQEAGAETEEIYLPDYDIRYCQGCMSCLSGDRCAIPDDLNRLREKLVEADGLILSSPTYGLAPNAMMKNFSDRVGMYSIYRTLLGGKYVAGIATAGAIGARKTAKMLPESPTDSTTTAACPASWGFPSAMATSRLPCRRRASWAARSSRTSAHRKSTLAEAVRKSPQRPSAQETDEEKRPGK